MTVMELKQYVFEKEKIKDVLESIGCHHIRYHSGKEYYSCANHDGDNISAINVQNNPYLNVVNWTRPSDFDEMSDLITLVQYAKSMSFIDAVKYIHSVLGLEFKNVKKAKNPRSLFSVKNIMKENTMNVYVI